MARSGNLDVRTIDAAKPRGTAYRLSDGGGLLLLVKPKGAKIWIVRLTVAGKRRDMGLGGYPGVSLREARDKATAARKQAGNGVDPIAERERQAREREAERKASAEADARTFRSVAEACIKAETPGWKNKRTALIWTVSDAAATPLHFGAHRIRRPGGAYAARGLVDDFRDAVQVHGRSVCSSWALVRPETTRSSTSVSHAVGFTPFSFAVWISVIAMAQ